MRQQVGLIILLMGLLVASLSLNLLQAETAAMLVERNKALLAEPVPVKNCTLTPWYNADGSITVVVNGIYAHRIKTRCRGL